MYLKTLLVVFLLFIGCSKKNPIPRLNAKLLKVHVDGLVIGHIDADTGEIFPLNETRKEDIVRVLLTQISEQNKKLAPPTKPTKTSPGPKGVLRGGEIKVVN